MYLHVLKRTIDSNHTGDHSVTISIAESMLVIDAIEIIL